MIRFSKHSFMVTQIYREPTAAPSPNDRFYPDLKICLVLAGQAMWQIEERTFSVQRGDIVFLNIGQHRRFLSFGEEGLSLCVFTFPRNALSQLHHYIFFRDLSKKNPLQDPKLYLILNEVLSFWRTGSPLRYEWAEAKFTEFFIRAEQLEDFCPDAITPQNLDILNRMDQIDASIANGLTLRQIAKAAGLSESAFSRRFSSAAGISFKQYAMEKKMQRALELLKNTDMKIIDIAAECGFESISGFYDTFRKLLGTTPNKLRSEF